MWKFWGDLKIIPSFNRDLRCQSVVVHICGRVFHSAKLHLKSRDCIPSVPRAHFLILRSCVIVGCSLKDWFDALDVLEGFVIASFIFITKTED